jgi:phosphoserine phosphatase
MTKIKLVVFDMDGTLIYHTSSMIQLTKFMHDSDIMEIIEHKYRNSILSYREVVDISAVLLRDLSLVDAQKVYQKISKIHNIRAVIEELHSKGIPCILLTNGPKFMADFFQQEFQFDAVGGTQIEFKKGKCTGKVKRYFEGKVEFVKNYCKSNHLSMKDVIAIGDSISDQALFDVLGKSIAINYDHNLEGKASYYLKTQDLRKVLPYIFQ